MAWDPAQYLKFEDERTRPVDDLLRAVPTKVVRDAMDLGCGPGNSTEALARRYPDARLSGMDSSAEMIAAARGRLPSARFQVGVIEDWETSDRFDIILANAILHWVPDHEQLLPRLVERLSPGGSLAIQIPDNLAQPSHQALQRLAISSKWSGSLDATLVARTPIREPQWYFDHLRPFVDHLSVWRTVYYHRIEEGIDGVLEWFKGSALRPILEALQPDDRGRFLAEYREMLSPAYAHLADGAVLLPFPRFFLIALR